MKIDLGSGYYKRDGFISIDIRPECKPDIVCDIAQGLPFNSNSIEYVRAHDFLEHIPRDRIIFVIEEIYRVLVPNGILDHCTPSDDGRGYAMDPTHINPMNLNSWWYYQKDEYRQLYNIKAKFAGSNKNLLTDPLNKIIYVVGILRAVKE